MVLHIFKNISLTCLFPYDIFHHRLTDSRQTREPNLGPRTQQSVLATIRPTRQSRPFNSYRREVWMSLTGKILNNMEKVDMNPDPRIQLLKILIKTVKVLYLHYDNTI